MLNLNNLNKGNLDLILNYVCTCVYCQFYLSCKNQCVFSRIVHKFTQNGKSDFVTKIRSYTHSFLQIENRIFKIFLQKSLFFHESSYLLSLFVFSFSDERNSDS